jgi:hypothetical protein
VPPSLRHRCHDAPDKISYCPLELDLPIDAILNRRSVSPRNIHHDFVELLDPDSIIKDKLVMSVRELWHDERKRREARGEEGPTEVTDSSQRQWDARDPSEPVWRVEDELREKVDALAKDDLAKFRSRMGFASKLPEFDKYVEDNSKSDGVELGYLARIKTTFEQVEALFPARMEEDERRMNEYGAWAVKGIGVDVAGEAAANAKGKGGLRDDSVIQVDEKVLQATQGAILDAEQQDELDDLFGGERDSEIDPRALTEEQKFAELKRRAREANYRRDYRGRAEGSDVEEEDEGYLDDEEPLSDSRTKGDEEPPAAAIDEWMSPEQKPVLVEHDVEDFGREGPGPQVQSPKCVKRSHSSFNEDGFAADGEYA